MKRLSNITALSRLAAIVCLLTITVLASAMTYEQAREQALFLTDKMAYELNLSQEQYEAAYEINLDYLMNVTTVDEVYSEYWYQRNIDMQYIMLDWQYSAFCATNYFYRPLYWDSGYWHFGIYAYYPHRDVFYFDRPAVYVSYRGSHGWRAGGGRSWYADRTAHYRGTHRSQHIGLRDRHYQRNGISTNRQGISRTSSNINRQNMTGASRNGYRSSTRTTVGSNMRNSRYDNDDMYSTGRSSNYNGSNRSSSGGFSRNDYSSGSSRHDYSSGNSNINRQNYGSGMSRQSYGSSSSSRQSYGNSSSSSRQSYGSSSSSRQSYGSSSYGGSSSSRSSYGGSSGNISSFGSSRSSSSFGGSRSSSSMGSRSSSSMGTRSSGSMGGSSSHGGGSRGSMSRH